MKRIAIITNGSLDDRKGLFNAVHNRIKHLISITTIEFDVIMLCVYDPWYVRLLRHTLKSNKVQTFDLEGVHYNIKWRRFSLIDYLLEEKFKTIPIFKRCYYKKIARSLKEYNFIVSHSDCGNIALEAKNKYQIPFTVTWHGSDIHTEPFCSSYIKNHTQLVIENADCNYFVSRALMECSNKITTIGKKDVLYNGSDMAFTKYNESKRIRLRKKMNVINKKVVTFCGSFYEIKNILVIPEIFRRIYEKEKDVIFWMIGDGKYRPEVEKLIIGLPVVLWGNQSPESIPEFFNVTDVLILPSKNEGLPLVTVEALKCGCHVVGSLVGGIPEVIGKENCVPLDSDTFVDDFANKVYYYLHEGCNSVQKVSSCFNWRDTAEQELKFIRKYISN